MVVERTKHAENAPAVARHRNAAHWNSMVGHLAGGGQFGIGLGNVLDHHAARLLHAAAQRDFARPGVSYLRRLGHQQPHQSCGPPIR